MAGPGPGEIRLSIEAGTMTRFAVRGRVDPKATTAVGMLRQLSTMTAELQLQLERAADREESAQKEGPDPVAAGRGRVQTPSTRRKEKER